MSAFPKLTTAVDAVCRVAGELDAGALRSEEAVAALATVTHGERALAAVRLALLRRIEETGAWVGKGDSQPGYFIARATGVSVGEANAALDTAS